MKRKPIGDAAGDNCGRLLTLYVTIKKEMGRYATIRTTTNINLTPLQIQMYKQLQIQQLRGAVQCIATVGTRISFWYGSGKSQATTPNHIS